MKRVVIAMALAFIVAGPAAASDKTDVMTVLHQWVDSFNKGDMKTAMAICADATSIIDDVPPHEWHGAGACNNWLNDYDAYVKTGEITEEVFTMSKPRHVEVTADRAYVVAPMSFSYKAKGKPIMENGAIFTIALQKGATGWRITGWAWTEGR